ncbi:MAG: hypothetical protein ACK5YM_03615, partial [Pseudomonadota bacterium]
HDWILCFSNHGRVYWLKVWEVPQGVTLIALDDGTRLSGLQRIAENDAAAEAGDGDTEPGGRP